MKRTLIPLLTLAAGLLAVSAPAADWIVLFDGKPTDKLRGYKQKSFPTNFWVIDGDALKTVPGKALDLVTADKYKDYELEFEWKVAPGGNSGVIYNVVEGPVKDMPLFAKSMEGGLIAFQHHGQEAWYRNLRIRTL